MECKEYLELKPKYTSFAAKQEPKTKPTRPPSKKATLKAKSDAELVSKAVLAVKGETNRPIGGVQEGFFEQAGGFLAVASSALDGYIHSQQQKAILELLDTPEKKQFAREQMKLQISEMQAKRRNLSKQWVGWGIRVEVLLLSLSSFIQTIASFKQLYTTRQLIIQCHP